MTYTSPRGRPALRSSSVAGTVRGLRMTRTRRAAGVTLATILLVSGCATTGYSPTPDEQFDTAEQIYLDYRETVNGVLTVIHDGPWEVATYGITPNPGTCDDGWQFEFARTTRIEPASIPPIRAAAADHLEAQGFVVDDLDLEGTGTSSSDLIVREQGVYSLLTVTFVSDGDVVVTATTACAPGDADALGQRLFGGDPLDAGPMPAQESPSDPVQFAVPPSD